MKEKTNERPSILVLEDSVVLLHDLADRIKSFLDCELILAGSYTEATGLPDIAILDIELQGEQNNGVDVAEALNANRHVPVIYISKIQEDSELEKRISNTTFHKSFLSKPISNTALRIAVNNALKAVGKKNLPHLTSDVSNPIPGHILVRNGNATHNLKIHEILYIKADGEYSKVYTSRNTNPILVSTHLKELLVIFARYSGTMVRISRFSAVNLMKVSRIEDSPRNLSKKKVIVVDGTEDKLELSPNYKADFLKRFNSI